MGLAISRRLAARLLAEAAATPEGEVCGLLFGNDDVVIDARACANVANDPARTFEIDPAALLGAHRAARSGGPRIIGHYHSHPSGSPVPSATDAAAAAPDGSLWLILGGGEIGAWRAVPRGAIEGRFDSVALDIGCAYPPHSPEERIPAPGTPELPRP